MFEKFGEFDSAEELNRAAAAQLKRETMKLCMRWRQKTVSIKKMSMIT